GTQRPGLGHAVRRDQVGDLRAPRRPGTTTGVALPETVQVDDLGLADKSREVTLGPGQAHTGWGRDGVEGRGRWSHDADAPLLVPRPEFGGDRPGHPEDARHHPAVAPRVEAVAEVEELGGVVGPLALAFGHVGAGIPRLQR